MKLKLIDIEKFHSDKNIAFVGLSSKGKQFSNSLFSDMKKNGYNLFPVNPKMEEFDGTKVFNSIDNIPSDIVNALVLTPKSETKKVVDELIEKGIKNIWIQQGAHSPELKNINIPEDVNFVLNECFYLYMEPVTGPHAFHRFIKKLFGTYPK
jgi:uncharacterized protein